MLQLEDRIPPDLIGRLLRPRSIAVVGASDKPGSFGASILQNLQDAHFDGMIYPINPKRSEVFGRPCLSTLDDLPDGVDCAVLAIPGNVVLASAEACARRGVRSVIVFSAGFAESGEQGRVDQQRLSEIARKHGMVLEGPNCLGLVNHVDGVPLTFVSTAIKRPTGSGVAVLSQSGAMAAVLGVSFRKHGMDISYSVSTGNEACAHLEDFLEYLLGDSSTRVLALIVEQFRQPSRFLELSRRAAALGQWIVLLHPGRSQAARHSAATHTGAMAGDYRIMRAKVEDAGVVVVETLEELVDVSQVLLRCSSLPRGGAAVVTESGAFKAITLDLCDDVRLLLPTLDEKTSEELSRVLPPFIPPANPLDITAQGLVDPDLYRRVLPPLLHADVFGSVVLGIILTDEATAKLKLKPLVEALREIRPAKPILFAALDEGAPMPVEFAAQLEELGIPFYPSPERAFRALARVTEMARKGGRGTRPFPSGTRGHRLHEGVVPEHAAKGFLTAAGIPVPDGALATTVDEAVEIAKGIGFPLVLKAQSKELCHKSDGGGVALNIQNEAQLREEWHAMRAVLSSQFPGLQLDGILVEAMSGRGVELILGAQRDKDWGLVLLIGFGGVQAEAIRDVRIIVPELSEAEIVHEFHSLKSSALLSGFRSLPPVDVPALARVARSLAEFMELHPEVNEVDINPLMGFAHGAMALDALLVVQPAGA